MALVWRALIQPFLLKLAQQQIETPICLQIHQLRNASNLRKAMRMCEPAATQNVLICSTCIEGRNENVSDPHFTHSIAQPTVY